MLATGAAPVSNVALSCNYSNPSKFSAAFKRQFDVNPTEYRRKKFEQLAGHEEAGAKQVVDSRKCARFENPKRKCWENSDAF